MGKDLSELTTYMRLAVERLIQRANLLGLDLVVVDTGRTPAEQKIKVEQGVSWTPRSRHLPQPPEMKSEAIDIVPRACITQKYWGWWGTVESSDKRWGLLGAIGEELGLEWGGRWANDPPHSRSDPGHFQWQRKAEVKT